MAQDQEQRSCQRQGGRGSATEGHRLDSTPEPKGEIQARSPQSKGQGLDHLWLGTNAPKSDVGKE